MIKPFTPYSASESGNQLLYNLQLRIKTTIDQILSRLILDGRFPEVYVRTAAGARSVSTESSPDAEMTSLIPVTTSFQNIPHGLGRKPEGWIVVSPDADTRIWEDSAANNPDATKYIRVRASAAVNCRFWVF